MSKEGNFLIYCTEQYKTAKGLTGRQVSELFTKYRVWDYIYSCFEALHTTGEMYIVEDIDLYIEARRQVMAQSKNCNYVKQNLFILNKFLE